MSPFPAQRTWSKATWEIMESEHIDFPATDPGGSPDEELQRKCNNLILLQPGPAAPAALSLPGWGHGAAPPDLGALHSGATVWHCQAAPLPPLPNPSSTPELRCSLRPHFWDMQGSPAASESKGLLERGKPQIRVFLLPAHPN